MKYFVLRWERIHGICTQLMILVQRTVNHGRSTLISMFGQRRPLTDAMMGPSAPWNSEPSSPCKVYCIGFTKRCFRCFNGHYWQFDTLSEYLCIDCGPVALELALSRWVLTWWWKACLPIMQPRQPKDNGIPGWALLNDAWTRIVPQSLNYAVVIHKDRLFTKYIWALWDL